MLFNDPSNNIPDRSALKCSSLDQWLIAWARATLSANEEIFPNPSIHSLVEREHIILHRNSEIGNKVKLKSNSQKLFKIRVVKETFKENSYFEYKGPRRHVD